MAETKTVFILGFDMNASVNTFLHVGQVLFPLFWDHRLKHTRQKLC